MDVKLGQCVQFRPTHLKELQLTDKVEKIYEDGRSVDVMADAGDSSVSRLYSVDVNDCVAIEQQQPTGSTEEQRIEDAAASSG